MSKNWELGKHGAFQGTADEWEYWVDVRQQRKIRLEGWLGVKLYKALNAKVRSFKLIQWEMER